MGFHFNYIDQTSTCLGQIHASINNAQNTNHYEPNLLSLSRHLVDYICWTLVSWPKTIKHEKQHFAFNVRKPNFSFDQKSKCT